MVVFSATVDADGRVRLRDAGAFAAHCQRLAGEPVEVVVRPARRRSHSANARYWALLTVAARSLGWDDGPEALHEALAHQLLALPTDPRTGLTPRRRTPALRSAEFTDYVDMVEACLVHLGADLTGWQDEAVA